MTLILSLLSAGIIMNRSNQHRIFVTSFRQKLITFLQGTNPTERQAFLAHLTASELTHLIYDWQIWARAKQLPPEGDWVIWLIMAGRGFGKTRAGAEWIRSVAMTGSTA